MQLGGVLLKILIGTLEYDGWGIVEDTGRGC